MSRAGRTFWKVTRYARAARFWLLLALAALAWLGCSGDARAQTTVNCHNMSDWGTGVVPYCGTRQEAHDVVLAFRGMLVEVVIDIRYGGGLCGGGASTMAYRVDGRLPGGSVTYACRRILNPGCPAGSIWNDMPGQKRCMPSCSGRGEPTFTPRAGAILPNGSVGCSDGCEYMAASNGDGTYTRYFIGDNPTNHCSVVPNDCANNGAGYHMNFSLGMCVPPMPKCEANETKNPQTGECDAGCPPGMSQDALGACVTEPDKCPAGHIRAPSGECLPGEGQCAAGEARKPDGTCGKDSDGDGTADEFDPDTDSTSFSGGDNCNAPPSCSGDPIMCGQARIQWRIECNTRDDAKVSGGSCGAVPVCAGKNCKALEYAQLLQQWRASCALEKLAEGQGGGESGQPAWTRVDGMNQDPSQGSGSGDEPSLGSVDIDGEDLDQTPIVGGGGSCPALGASGTGALVDNLVAMVNNPGAAWCSYIAAVYSILVLFGMATSILIMAKGW